MAPNLAVAQHDAIRDMINSGLLTNVQIAQAAGCSERSVRTIRANLRDFGTTTAPRSRPGPGKLITPPIRRALHDQLLHQSDLFLSEMVAFLQREFQVEVSPETVRRELVAMGWSRKITRRVAQERNAELRDFYLHTISAFHSYQLIFVDESSCDRRCAFRRRGWAPRGVTPVQTARFQRGPHYQILPAYTQEGILLSRVYEGTTDATIFTNFIEQLLHHCQPFPQPRSVLIMDNASILHSQQVRDLCAAAGVQLVFLPPYSPDLNPIELWFSVLKNRIKQVWLAHTDDPTLDFRALLEQCVDTISLDVVTAEGHFRHANILVEHW